MLRSSRLTVSALAGLTLLSCQTVTPVSPNTTTETVQTAVSPDVICRTMRPIMASHRDMLTIETARQVGDHNNIVWCACPALRPAGWTDAMVCEGKLNDASRTH